MDDNPIQIDRGGFDVFVGNLDDAPENIKSAMEKAMWSCGKLLLSVSKAYCPRSPSTTENRNNGKKKGKKGKKGGAKNSNIELPGGLEKSIDAEYNGDTCSVFVDANGAGAKYARYIHDGKGTKWFNRGLGTIAKGDKADAKFIERAFTDCEQDVYETIDGLINEEFQKL